MKETIIFIGLDTHKDRISVALAESAGERELRYLGEIDNTPEAVGVRTQFGAISCVIIARRGGADSALDESHS